MAMASLDDIVQKIPRPILVIGVLVTALGLIISQNPLQDGCDVQLTNFSRVVRGILTGYKTQKKLTQFAQIENFKSLCREGNSQGACENYYLALKKMTDGLKMIDDKCIPKLVENYENMNVVISNAIQIMALNAWGEKPPASVSERMGWLAESQIFTFCRLKAQFVRLSSEEDYKKLRAKTYAEFPDAWPESVSLSQRAELPRPTALRSATNTKGSLVEEEVFKRSLFSLRCDLYL
jgi:hypothetical protein